jgi:endoglycosylceramidase
MTRNPARTLLAVTVALLALVLPSGASAALPPGDPAGRGPVGPLTGDGRWLVDAQDRVVVLHGMNEVTKRPPWHPAAGGFGADDARFLSEHGFNVVRLGVEFVGLMPSPGIVDPAYVDAIAGIVRDLRREGIYTLLDFHQDGYGVGPGDNGFPEWMTITDDQVDNGIGFPLYYVANPAVQRAFENFWRNREGPGGVGIQDRFIEGLRAVAQRFASDPSVLGYELMNEPWPGADFAPCFTVTGCPDLEQGRLAPFYRRATAAVREITSRQQVFVEPFSTFNFGFNGTTLPGRGSGDALATHSYAPSPAGELRVRDESVAAAERDAAPLLVTEFGATQDATTLRRLLDGFGERAVSWVFWAYNENIVRDRTRPAGLDALVDPATFRALVEPYPAALAGVPATTRFDAATRTYELAYTPRRPGGGRYVPAISSVVFVPRLQYPDGYTVEVAGAAVTSRRCSERLTLRNRLPASSVRLRIVPGAPPGGCARR